MPNTKAALPAPGSADLTNSLASPSWGLTRFPEHYVRAVASNLYISIQAQNLLSHLALCSFQRSILRSLMQVREMQIALVPSVTKSDYQIL